MGFYMFLPSNLMGFPVKIFPSSNSMNASRKGKCHFNAAFYKTKQWICSETRILSFVNIFIFIAKKMKHMTQMTLR